MINSHLRNFLFIWVFLLVTGCSSLPDRMDGEKISNEDVLSKSIKQREATARRYQASGDLFAAANEWHILTLLNPRERSYRHHLAVINDEIDRSSTQAFDKGMMLYQKKQLEESSRYMLKVLALSPGHVEAVRILREIEKQKMANIQNIKAARAAKAIRYKKKVEQEIDVLGKSTLSPDQQIEMFMAGDIAGGLREMRLYAEANPDEKENRQRIANVVYEEAQKLDQQGSEEEALRLYEQAIFLRGDKFKPWRQHIHTLRSKLVSEYYAKGIEVYRQDISAAIKYWEKALNIDPHYTNAATRLKTAKKLQEKLQKF